MMTKQEIVNLALMRLGNKKLKDVDEAYISNIYGSGKRKMLSLDYWTFARRSLQLALIDDDSSDVPSKRYKYEVPIDVANITKIYGNNNFIERDYSLMGKNLYSSYNPLWIEYTSNDYSEDDSVPDHFGDALCYWMAKELAAVMGNQNAMPIFNQLYQQALKDAIGINGRDIPSQIIPSDYYTNARI